MNFFHFIVFGVLVSTNLAFHIQKGCEVKREWKEEISWQNFNIRAWAQSNISEVIKLKLTFNNWKLEELYDDTFVVHRNSYEFIKNRDFVLTSNVHNTSLEIPDGWNEFMFHINKNYSMLYINNEGLQLLMEHEIDDRLKSLTVKGSNVTMNCPSGTKVWKVSGDHKVVVPLDSSHIHNVTIYSHGHMKPAIILGDKEYSLGWNGISITTVNKEHLPPYEQYNISIICEETLGFFSCDLKVGDNIPFVTIPMRSIPEFITFKRRDGDNYSVIIHDEAVAAPEIVESVISSSQIYLNGKVVIIVLAIVIVILVCLGLGYFLFKKKIQRKQKSSTTTQIDEPREMEPLNSKPGKWEEGQESGTSKQDDVMVPLNSGISSREQRCRSRTSSQIDDPQDVEALKSRISACEETSRSENSNQIDGLQNETDSLHLETVSCEERRSSRTSDQIDGQKEKEPDSNGTSIC